MRGRVLFFVVALALLMSSSGVVAADVPRYLPLTSLSKGYELYAPIPVRVPTELSSDSLDELSGILGEVVVRTQWIIDDCFMWPIFPCGWREDCGERVGEVQLYDEVYVDWWLLVELSDGRLAVFHKSYCNYDCGPGEGVSFSYVQGVEALEVRLSPPFSGEFQVKWDKEVGPKFEVPSWWPKNHLSRRKSFR